jgi:uncharacterized protein (TIGR02145 family)
MQHKIIPLFLLLCVAFTWAQSNKYVAVFETVTYEQNLVTEGERRVLTDDLRRLALSVLPTSQFTVMTRDNITELLPPGKTLEECAEGQCLVEIGRNVSAEYAAQGTVNRFGSSLALTVECYETKGGKLIGSFVVREKTVEGLLAGMQEQAPELFGKILQTEAQPASNPPPSSSSTMKPYSSSSTVKVAASFRVAYCDVFKKIPYNPETQFCSGNKVLDLCGGLNYDEKTEFCLAGVVSTIAYCDAFKKVPYNPDTQFCSGDKVLDLCGGLDYDEETELCLADVIEIKCGVSSYDPDTEFCLGDKVYALCGGASYVPKTQICENGKVKVKTSFVDSRDGKVYRVTLITSKYDSQLWMAENLEYKAGATICQQPYGCYYTWAQAMNIDGKYNSQTPGAVPEKLQGICPSGWHLPSESEWMELGATENWELMAVSGWPSRENGQDKRRFSALPGGSYNGSFHDMGDHAYWWSTKEYDASNADYWEVATNRSSPTVYSETKNLALNVRCIQD